MLLSTGPRLLSPLMCIVFFFFFAGKGLYKNTNYSRPYLSEVEGQHSPDALHRRVDAASSKGMLSIEKKKFFRILVFIYSLFLTRNCLFHKTLAAAPRCPAVLLLHWVEMHRFKLSLGLHLDDGHGQIHPPRL